MSLDDNGGTLLGRKIPIIPDLLARLEKYLPVAGIVRTTGGDFFPFIGCAAYCLLAGDGDCMRVHHQFLHAVHSLADKIRVLGFKEW